VCLSQAAEERASAVLRARACYRERDRAGERKRERDDDARFNQQFVLILVGAVSPLLGLCSPSLSLSLSLFLSCFPVFRPPPVIFILHTERKRERERELYILLYTYTSIYRRLGSSMFSSLPFRAPPDLFPMSPTQPTLLL
jgi:hypothetical protein